MLALIETFTEVQACPLHCQAVVEQFVLNHQGVVGACRINGTNPQMLPRYSIKQNHNMLLNHDPPIIGGAGVVVIAPYSNVGPDRHLH
jgi:hypothetical protein